MASGGDIDLLLTGSSEQLFQLLLEEGWQKKNTVKDVSSRHYYVKAYGNSTVQLDFMKSLVVRKGKYNYFPKIEVSDVSICGFKAISPEVYFKYYCFKTCILGECKKRVDKLRRIASTHGFDYPEFYVEKKIELLGYDKVKAKRSLIKTLRKRLRF